MLQSDLRDCNQSYVVVKGIITVEGANNRNSVLIENVEDLDVVMPLYNLLRYSKDYSLTSGSLSNYYRYE